jgi:hypothetical protein
MIATLVTFTLALQSEDLGNAVKKATEMECYAFKIDVQPGKGKKPPVVEGKYQKDQPMALKSGSVEGFKKAAQVIVKDGEEYKRVDRPKKAPKKGADAGVSFYEVKMPHEELEGLDQGFDKVEKAAEKDGDCTVWSGALLPETARKFGSTGSKAEVKGNYTYSGTAKVWITPQGLISKYSYSLQIKGQNNKGEFDLHSQKTVELSEIGTAKVELPDAAKKALEGQP